MPPGDQGGPMTNGAAYLGTIALADEDLWAFTASARGPINLRLSPTNSSAT